MKTKPSRRRIDVNLDELDRIIDGGTSAPLTKADSQKLKTALHAMAERLTRRSTEETRALLEPGRGWGTHGTGKHEEARCQRRLNGNWWRWPRS